MPFASSFIVVCADAEEATVRARARVLAAELQVSLETVRPPDPTGPPALVVTAGGLALHDAEGGTGVRSALTGPLPRDRLTRRQPLGGAIGRDARLVVDATAGLGHDTVLLLRMGYHVVAVERSPVLAALLRDGLEAARTARPDLAARLEVVCADARSWLETWDGPPPDAIYVDPMFPPKRKASALARKRIRLVRALVGDDADADGLVASARSCARRVVVKRPRRSAPIGGPPAFSVEGKMVRYDVYLRS